MLRAILLRNAANGPRLRMTYQKVSYPSRSMGRIMKVTNLMNKTSEIYKLYTTPEYMKIQKQLIVS